MRTPSVLDLEQMAELSVCDGKVDLDRQRQCVIDSYWYCRRKQCNGAVVAMCPNFLAMDSMSWRRNAFWWGLHLDGRVWRASVINSRGVSTSIQQRNSWQPCHRIWWSPFWVVWEHWKCVCFSYPPEEVVLGMREMCRTNCNSQARSSMTKLLCSSLFTVFMILSSFCWWTGCACLPISQEVVLWAVYIKKFWASHQNDLEEVHNKITIYMRCNSCDIFHILMGGCVISTKTVHDKTDVHFEV